MYSCKILYCAPINIPRGVEERFYLEKCSLFKNSKGRLILLINLNKSIKCIIMISNHVLWIYIFKISLITFNMQKLINLIYL